MAVGCDPLGLGRAFDFFNLHFGCFLYVFARKYTILQFSPPDNDKHATIPQEITGKALRVRVKYQNSTR